jgi:hypothetical protein
MDNQLLNRWLSIGYEQAYRLQRLNKMMHLLLTMACYSFVGYSVCGEPNDCSAPMTSSGFLQLTHHMHSSKGGYEHGVAAFLLVGILIDIFPNAMFNGAAAGETAG